MRSGGCFSGLKPTGARNIKNSRETRRRTKLLFYYHVQAISGADKYTERLGKIKVTDFEDKQMLRPIGNNYYDDSNAKQTTAQQFIVSQGHLEGSNVNMVENMTRLIEVSRAYEAYQKSMEKQLDAAKQVNQIAKI